ncbi:hypothetical protein AJ78_08419 [Emergomyces pasteurianus Ep9510]|uniref:Uncharacterized protein n=1 Tax=Emergomyces pasteurianus Ep9510 TaxID=1447872 RepID=A0A1J9P2M2_9EURO|nr:hypothetical protein AJ78_08419 [Emergomyces pasteurianus Ep9510]
MAIFMYDTTFPGSVDGSFSPQLHIVHLLKACTPDSRSDEEPQHLLSMLMPVPLFPASGDLFKNAASEEFADFSALSSIVSGLDGINWDEWILFDSSPVDVTPPSLQLSDFFNNLIEKVHSSPSDVADDPLNRREPISSLASDNLEDNTLKKLLNYFDGFIEVKILKLVYKQDGDEMYQIVERIDLQETREYGTKEKPWQCLGSAEDLIIIDESMSSNLLSNFDSFVAISFL